MRKDPKEFRERFKRWKAGEKVYEAGRTLPEVVITPDKQYNKFLNTLPDNQRLTPEEEYTTHRYWELNDKPKNFEEAINKKMYSFEDDKLWHGNSVAYNKNTDNYEFMKPRNHPTVHYETDWYSSDEPNAVQFRKEYDLQDDKNRPGFYKYQKRVLPKFDQGTEDEDIIEGGTLPEISITEFRKYPWKQSVYPKWNEVPIKNPYDRQKISKEKQIKDAEDFVRSYYNSKGFKERFNKLDDRIKEYKNSEYNLYPGTNYDAQLDTFKLNKIKLNDEILNYADYDRISNDITVGNLDNRVTLYEPEYVNLHGQYGETAAHELGHALDNSIKITPNVPYSYLYPTLRDNTNSNVLKTIFEAQDKFHNTNYSYTWNTDPDLFYGSVPGFEKETHDGNPTEAYADLMRFRYELNKNGIYDSRKSNNPFNEQHLSKFKKLLKKDKNNYRLFNNFDDKQIINIMNTVAQNNQQTDGLFRADGGKSEDEDQETIDGGTLPEIIYRPSKEDKMALKAIKTIFPDKQIRNSFYDYHYENGTNSQNTAIKNLAKLKNDSKNPKYFTHPSLHIPCNNPDGTPRAHYLPAFNRMYNIHNIHDYIAELSHAWQYYGNGYKYGLKTNSFLPGDIKINQHFGYDRPGHGEYNAHSIIEPAMHGYILGGREKDSFEKDFLPVLIYSNKEYNQYSTDDVLKSRNYTYDNNFKITFPHTYNEGKSIRKSKRSNLR